MRLIIENWSAPSLLTAARIKERCEERGFDFFQISAAEFDQYPFFKELIGNIPLPDPVLYIVKMRPVDTAEKEWDEFKEWLLQNDFDVDYDYERDHRDPEHSDLHGDFYGDKLQRLVTGNLSIPLLPSDIAEFRSTEAMRTIIREGARRRHSERL